MSTLLAKLTSVGLLASVAIHASAGTTFWLWTKFGGEGAVQEFELATHSQKSRPSTGKKISVEDEEWFLVAKKRNAAQPTKPEKIQEEGCKGVCDEKGEGDFVAASDAYRKPRWVGNFITPADYPAIAREQGKDGRVVLSVIINEDGRVRSVQLIQGSYAALNDVALAKVRGAVFSPAYDNDGNAVACKVRLPIRFELRS